MGILDLIIEYRICRPFHSDPNACYFMVFFMHGRVLFGRLSLHAALYYAGRASSLYSLQTLCALFFFHLHCYWFISVFAVHGWGCCIWQRYRNLAIENVPIFACIDSDAITVIDYLKLLLSRDCKSVSSLTKPWIFDAAVCVWLAACQLVAASQLPWYAHLDSLTTRHDSLVLLCFYIGHACVCRRDQDIWQVQLFQSSVRYGIMALLLLLNYPTTFFVLSLRLSDDHVYDARNKKTQCLQEWNIVCCVWTCRLSVACSTFGAFSRVTLIWGIYPRKSVTLSCRKYGFMIVGPKPSWLIGSAAAIFGTDQIFMFQKWMQKFGPKPFAVSLGATSMVVISDPDDVR